MQQSNYVRKIMELTERIKDVSRMKDIFSDEKIQCQYDMIIFDAIQYGRESAESGGIL